MQSATFGAIRKHRIGYSRIWLGGVALTQTNRGIRTVNGTEADVGGVLTSIEAEGVRHTDKGEVVRRVAG